MDLEFLYDRTRDLFSIGYNVSERRRDVGCYDLLASESRLISYVAVAMGVVPQAHWFALGRLVTTWRGAPALLSWSGSMFEYLMPTLIMPSVPGSLLDETARTVVQRQIEYGRRLGLPWGVSESGYNLTDDKQNYQYKAFGVPGLGLQRGLADEQVVAPYATVMALMVEPAAAFTNLARMAAAGFEGRYGFYEAVDYTARRLGVGQRFALIQSYMAHHQGMSLLALAYTLLDRPMQRRFSARPELLATELLLHERVPRQAALFPHAHEVAEGAAADTPPPPALRVIGTADTPRPEVHLVSNGRYSVMLTNSGGGYSRWNELALTRWREDPTCDPWGTFVYVRDVDGGATWSATWQPTCVAGDHYEAIFPPSRVEFRRRDHGLELHTEITVSPEDDIELRRVTLVNLTSRRRVIELTTYAEVVLAPAAADDAHPAFSNLFVQTEILLDRQAILCTRRSRGEGGHTPVLLHRLTVHGPTDGPLSFETDRRTFIGRGRTAWRPAGVLSGTDGSVLDPIVAIRCRVVLAPEQSVRLHVVTGVAPTREDALVLVDRYADHRMADRVFELAWTHRQVLARQAGITDTEAELYLRAASPIVYADPARRAPAAILARNRRGQSSLWAYGISGDLPIVLLRVATLDSIELVRQVVRAHAWWRRLGLTVDLVIWDETEGGYHHALRDDVLGVVANGTDVPQLDAPGGVFLRRLDLFADDDRVLVETVARILLIGGGGTLAEQLAPRVSRGGLPSRLVPRVPQVPQAGQDVLQPDGFVDDGRGYRVTTTPTRRTPAPWSNVLSNPHFGSLVTESGGGYTWCENAHEFRVTPWSNDPVGDPCGEAYYLRDEATGQVWSPTPMPARGAAPYVTTHRIGWSSFTHTSFGVASELRVFVAVDAPVKVLLLRVVNLTDRPRSLSATGYCEWVLGGVRARSLLHVSTEVDPSSGAMLARNAYHPEFGARIAFFDVSERKRTVTGDRTEFVGRNGRLAQPAALGRECLSGRVGSGFDACGALMAPVTLGPYAAHELCFVLGVGRDLSDVRTLLHRFGRVPEAIRALEAVDAQWGATLGALHVVTPERSLDVLVNGWLPYQVVACRLWARTGFYQSGGAFGFRDQLQDAMALLCVRPEMLRDQIVLCAGRQFRDGDVQHWWHPPSGRGVRTHCSDDFLWLPAAVARYVVGVGDIGVLAVRAPYLEGRQVKPEEEAYGDLPHRSEEKASVYEHCVRAIERGLRFGHHGLPLMGSGDWNDGMNLVGARGRGESVWLALFLYDVLVRFAPVANVEANAWDGAWYRRAWFDGGEVLGSASNTECRIDSLPQSWAVLSGAGSRERAERAMHAVDERLVDRDLGIVRLFEPPFDVALPNPGYIKGYVPGVRENGGQYTHAAIWAAMAFAALGDWERAWEVTRLLDPASHTDSEAARARYRVEPYVMAADVYAVAPHGGMGGWTWHTGSAGWMLRLILESLLGLHLEVDRMWLTPCVPPTWEGFRVCYRYRRSPYTIDARPGTTASISVDGVRLNTPFFLLVDDAQPHAVVVVYERRGGRGEGEADPDAHAIT
jgi:cellobiose phosphorylase